MIEAETIAAYNASREPGTDTSVVCHAPFVSLNFNQDGQVTACCYNRKVVLGTYPHQSLREIWAGAEARAMREAFLEDRETPGCGLCFHQLRSANYEGALMRNYDRFSRAEGYEAIPEPATPTVLEFEISNLCNLECVMCDGRWSSAIRANREHLPALRTPYDNAFVEQLEEFLPSIAAARFLGGEPFLIKRHYQIWERLGRVNPEAELSITTNATILPDRPRELLEGLRAHIVVSLDTVDRRTFEAIRRNASFDQVMANVEYLIAYARRRGTSIVLAACPMIQNWRRLPELLEFCDRRGLRLHFNTVFRPPAASLATLPSMALGEVIDHLAGFRPAAEGWWGAANLKSWNGLILQLQTWRRQKLDFDLVRLRLESQLRPFVDRHPGLESGTSSADLLERVVPMLVRSLGTGRELAKVAHPEHDHAPREIRLQVETEDPSAHDLLLGLHLLCRQLDEAEEGGSIETEALLEERQTLRTSLAGLDPAGLAPLRRWLLERIRSEVVDSLRPWMSTVLGILRDPARWHQAVEDGLVELRRFGRDDSQRRKVRAYAEAMVAPFMPLPPGSAEAATSPWTPPPRPPIRTIDDLRCLGDAICIFHRWQEPDGDHAALRSRLDNHLLLLDRAADIAAICYELEGSEKALFELLANSADE